MDKIKAFFASKAFETFCWQTLNCFLGIIIVYLSGESWAYAPFVIALLNPFTKWINLQYLKDDQTE